MTRAAGGRRARLRPHRQPDAGRQPGDRRRHAGHRLRPDRGADRRRRGSASSSTPTSRSTRCRPSPISRRSRTRRSSLPDPEANPTGAKGIGEPPLMPTAPAIANAVFDAIGIRIRDAAADPATAAGGAGRARTRGRGARSDETVRLRQRRHASTRPSRCYGRDGNGARPLAGGTDLLTADEGGHRGPGPAGRHQARRGAGRRDRRRPAAGSTSGALATLAQIETAPAASGSATRRSPQAAALAATPQLRNMATIGGNLLQRPRCWYFRNPHIDCWLKGGDDCPAREGENRLHALFGATPAWRSTPRIWPRRWSPSTPRCGCAARRRADAAAGRVLRAADR